MRLLTINLVSDLARNSQTPDWTNFFSSISSCFEVGIKRKSCEKLLTMKTASGDGQSLHLGHRVIRKEKRIKGLGFSTPKLNLIEFPLVKVHMSRS